MSYQPMEDYGLIGDMHTVALVGKDVAGVAIRSSVNAQFPGQLHDIKAAIRFLKNDAARYGPRSRSVRDHGLVVRRLETAAMVGVTGNVPELEGEIGVTGPSSAVAAAVPLYPPTDFLQVDAHMIDCPYFNDLFKLSDCHSDPKSPESLLLGCLITTCPDEVAQANPITTWIATTPRC